MSDVQPKPGRDAASLARLKKLYIEEGRSAAEIARIRGYGETRNAIIGIIARAGFSRSPSAQKACNTGRRTGMAAAVVRPPRPERPAPRPANPENLPATLPIGAMTGPTLLQLAPNQCRNPVGPDPRTSGQPQMFCGRRVGYRAIEVSKGVIEDRVDVYCPQCAARNRASTPPSIAAREGLARMGRAFA